MAQLVLMLHQNRENQEDLEVHFDHDLHSNHEVQLDQENLLLLANQNLPYLHQFQIRLYLQKVQEIPIVCV